MSEQPQSWKVALNALVRAAVLTGQARPNAKPELIEHDLEPLIEAVVVLREDPVIAVRATGTSWRFSERFCAVTTISSTVAVLSWACAAPVESAARAQPINQKLFIFIPVIFLSQTRCEPLR